MHRMHDQAIGHVWLGGLIRGGGRPRSSDSARRHPVPERGRSGARGHADRVATATAVAQSRSGHDRWPRCLSGKPDTLPYRVAAVLLLLYAQPLVRVAAMRTEQIQVAPSEILVLLGKEPALSPSRSHSCYAITSPPPEPAHCQHRWQPVAVPRQPGRPAPACAIDHGPAPHARHRPARLTQRGPARSRPSGSRADRCHPTRLQPSGHPTARCVGGRADEQICRGPIPRQCWMIDMSPRVVPIVGGLRVRAERPTRASGHRRWARLAGAQCSVGVLVDGQDLADVVLGDGRRRGCARD
jgi:hypothetical protein